MPSGGRERERERGVYIFNESYVRVHARPQYAIQSFAEHRLTVLDYVGGENVLNVENKIIKLAKNFYFL